MERHRAACLATPTWVEVGTLQPVAAAGDVTTSSPPPNAVSVLPKEGATAPSPFPFEMRNAATTYASSISTNMSAYEDLPGHHLLSICNLIASSPDDSYPDTTGTIADDINFFMNNFMASEWDYSGVRNLDAFRSFQLAANYCLTCSENSSEGDYDPTWECFMVELADGVVDEAPSDDGNNEDPPPANQVVAPSEPSRFVELGSAAGAAGATHRAREKARGGASPDTTAAYHA